MSIMSLRTRFKSADKIYFIMHCSEQAEVLIFTITLSGALSYMWCHMYIHQRIKIYEVINIEVNWLHSLGCQLKSWFKYLNFLNYSWCTSSMKLIHIQHILQTFELFLVTIRVAVVLHKTIEKLNIFIWCCLNFWTFLFNYSWRSNGLKLINWDIIFLIFAQQQQVQLLFRVQHYTQQ